MPGERSYRHVRVSLSGGMRWQCSGNIHDIEQVSLRPGKLTCTSASVLVSPTPLPPLSCPISQLITISTEFT